MSKIPNSFIEKYLKSYGVPYHHYDWLERNFPIFLTNIGQDIRNLPGIIVADGDKCYSYEEKWKKHGIHFFHGVALYLLTSFYPYYKEVRETKNGWVDVSQWVIDNFKRFQKDLPPI